MSDNFNKNRIAKNSILLYVRMLFTMWLNLYATRLVLKNLGVDDMGVYGVVGSVVGLFAVFSSGITNTIQRFITFELGKDVGNVNKVFCSSLNIIFLLSTFIFLLLESVGIWFLNNRVNIPPSSMQAAIWVYQLSVLTCIVNLISIPYNALVIAHEKMDAYALISIIQVILTCVAAYCLSLFDSKRLLVYAVMMTAISVLVRLFYQVYCHVKFEESRFHLFIDKGVMKQIGKFAGVTTFSGVLESLYNQGIILVINWTFGVAINAVYTIALQLKNSVLSFTFNIFKAMAPQITKTYASGEFETHKQLVYSASKIQVYMIYFIMIPFLFHTEYIMRLWLGNVPQYMVSFAQATIFLSLLYAMFEPIRTAVLATNNISKFMIIPCIYYIISLSFSYYFAYRSNNPVFLILSVVIFDVIGCVFRIYYALQVSPILLKEIINKVLVPIIIVGIVSATSCWLLTIYTNEKLLDLVILLVANSIILLVIIYLFGIKKQERLLVNDKDKKSIVKLKLLFEDEIK